MKNPFARRKPEPVVTPAPAPKPSGLRIAGHIGRAPGPDGSAVFKPAQVPAGVVPVDMAMDAIGPCGGYYDGGVGSYVCGGFLGYSTLAMISQKPLIRAAVTTLADEMVRKWIEIKSTAEDDTDSEPVQALTSAAEKYHLRKRFRDAAETTGFMGGCMLFIDVGVTDPDELAKPLVLDSAKIRKGSLKGFTLIEPMFTYPAPYNASNPLSPGFYAPDAWFVQGRKVHASRLLRFAANEVPILLKPAYNFYGIALGQLMLDYEEKFDIMRSDAGKIVTNFRTNVLKTNMGDWLQGVGTTSSEDILKRAAAFTQFGSNDGLVMLDKTTEELQQLITPMSGLSDLVAQALELLAAVCRMPAVKLLGISPSGFNSDDGADTNNWHEQVRSQQEKMFGDNLDIALKVIQLSEFGEVDDSLTYEFAPLKEPNAMDAATIRKTDMDADVAAVTAGIISPEESRKRLAGTPGSGYNGLDVDDTPEDPGSDSTELGG